MEYFSDRENGPRPRIEEVITPAAWGGIVGLVQALIATGAFGAKYPEMCPDGQGPCGTDERALGLAVAAEFPCLVWPLESHTKTSEALFTEQVPSAPDTLLALDFVEFCFRAVGKPIQGSFHPHFRHHHLSFDVESGQAEFRSDVNRILARNNLAYALREDGKVERMAPPVLREALVVLFPSGDSTLDKMLAEARYKFLSTDSRGRHDSLERLWDCWERLKSLEVPKDKKQSVSTLIQNAASDSAFRSEIESEAKALTRIGNSFHIRHSEVTQSSITDSQHIDYLFHRLFALIQLLIVKRGAR